MAPVISSQESYINPGDILGFLFIGSYPLPKVFVFLRSHELSDTQALYFSKPLWAQRLLRSLPSSKPFIWEYTVWPEYVFT